MTVHSHQTSPGLDLTVDLVPASETESPNDRRLHIADRKKDQWTRRSDVRRLRDKVAARNQACGGVWVNRVRQTKHSLNRDAEVKDLVCGLLRFFEKRRRDEFGDQFSHTDVSFVAHPRLSVRSAVRSAWRGVGGLGRLSRPQPAGATVGWGQVPWYSSGRRGRTSARYRASDASPTPRGRPSRCQTCRS